MFSISFTASRWQVTTYLLCIALFSISFLVFLNSEVSFVITDRIGQKDNVGDAVGTLGFADELVALVACPLWGIVSDRIGVRAVAVFGYAIVGMSLYVFVQAKNVYPQLLLARLFFSVGGTATATMVTAILPTMTYEAPDTSISRSPVRSANGLGHNITPSISSELTITPARFRRLSPTVPDVPKTEKASSTSQLAGLVGMFTGLGALIALFVFLPLPTRFQNAGQSPSDAIAHCFYVVGAVALLVSVGCFAGLRNLPGEANKSVRHLFRPAPSKSLEHIVNDDSEAPPTYIQLAMAALKLAKLDSRIFLGYLGGFVARASSVAISLFIPLFCNAYFISTGKCPSGHEPHETLPPDLKESCHRAYILAATLSGTSQLIALIFAPIFGYFSARSNDRSNAPLLVAAVTGIAGYVAFAVLQSPDPKSEDGSGGVFFIVALLGISQIGAIVCSLSLLGRGINDNPVEDSGARARPLPTVQISEPEEAVSSSLSPDPSRPTTAISAAQADADADAQESSPLLPPTNPPFYPSGIPTVAKPSPPRSQLKGTIAGLYSLFGGAGILLLTKMGGWLFDEAGKGAPFWLMAIFNGILLVGTAAVSLGEWMKKRNSEPERTE